MRLLDCGCGPGTITLGLAEVVAPGQAVGIDIETSQIALAQSHAAQQGTPNIRFQTGNVYALPFAAGSFDGVFTHGLLSYLTDRVQALREMGRV
jgi:ubiquinone/menaquinone biosynthesis C-methylase UbiE